MAVLAVLPSGLHALGLHREHWSRVRHLCRQDSPAPLSGNTEPAPSLTPSVLFPGADTPIIPEPSAASGLRQVLSWDLHPCIPPRHRLNQHRHDAGPLKRGCAGSPLFLGRAFQPTSCAVRAGDTWWKAGTEKNLHTECAYFCCYKSAQLKCEQTHRDACADFAGSKDVETLAHISLT